MPRVLTVTSSLECTHKGKVKSVASGKLTIQRSSVLTNVDVATASIDGCVTETDTNTATTKCKMVNQISVGEATKLTVQKKPVLLETLSGLTDGTVGGNFQPIVVVSVEHNKLRAL